MTFERCSEKNQLTWQRLANMNQHILLLQQQLNFNLRRYYSGYQRLTEVFCQTLVRCNVIPQFFYFAVTNQDMKNYLANYIKADVELHDIICEFLIEGVFVCIAVGSGKEMAQDLAVRYASSSFINCALRVSVVNRYRWWQNTYIPTLAILPCHLTNPELPIFFDGPNGNCRHPPKEEIKETSNCSKANVHWGPPVSNKLIKHFVLLYNDHYNYHDVKLIMLKDSAIFSGQGIDLLLETATKGGFVATLFLETYPIGDCWAEMGYKAKEGAIESGLEYLWRNCPVLSTVNEQVDKKVVLNKKTAKALGATLNADKRQCVLSDNMGHKMLESLGWCKGEGLGKKKTGRLVPILLEGDGLVRDLESRAGLGYGQQQQSNSGNAVVSRGEVDALVVNYLRTDTVEDLVFGDDFSNYEERLIQQVGFKYNLKGQKIAKKYLVLSRKVNIYTIIDQLNRNERKFVYSSGNIITLENIYTCKGDPELNYQDKRHTSESPDPLTNIKSELAVKKGGEDFDSQTEFYNAVDYIYTSKDNPPMIKKKQCVQSGKRGKIGGGKGNLDTLNTGAEVYYVKPKTVVGEVRALLSGKKKYGALSTWMDAQLKKTFGTELPKDWLINMKTIGAIRLGAGSGDWRQIYPVDQYKILENVPHVTAIVEDVSTPNSTSNDMPEMSINVENSETLNVKYEDSEDINIMSPHDRRTEADLGVASTLTTRNGTEADKNVSISQKDVKDLQNCLTKLNINSDKILKNIKRNTKDDIPRAAFLNRSRDSLVVRLVSVQGPDNLVLQDGSLESVQLRHRLSQEMASFYEGGNTTPYCVSNCKSGDYLAIYLSQEEKWVRARVMPGLQRKTSVTVRLVDTLKLKLLSGDSNVFYLERRFRELPCQSLTAKLDTSGQTLWASEEIMPKNKLLRAELVSDKDSREMIFRVAGASFQTTG